MTEKECNEREFRHLCEKIAIAVISGLLVGCIVWGVKFPFHVSTRLNACENDIVSQQKEIDSISAKQDKMYGLIWQVYQEVKK